MILKSVRIVYGRLLLKIWKKSSCFVLHTLTAEQKEDQAAACQDLIEMADIDPDFFTKIITGNKSWCFAYDPAMKLQLSTWVWEKSLQLQKLWFQKSQVKTMLVTFFSWLSLNSTEKWWMDFWKDFSVLGQTRLSQVTSSCCTIPTAQLSSSSFLQRKCLLFFTTPLLTRFGTCRLLSVL